LDDLQYAKKHGVATHLNSFSLSGILLSPIMPSNVSQRVALLLSGT
jgi:hypothetical protein